MIATSDLVIKKGASTTLDPEQAAVELYDAIYQTDISLALFYCSTDYDLEALSAALNERFGDTPLIGCTSAGEISTLGYLEGTLTGVSISSEDFKVVSEIQPNLGEFTFAQGKDIANRLKTRLSAIGEKPTGRNTFGFLLIDGLAKKEEAFVSAVYRNLGDIQLFGGSAADGLNFTKTYVFYDGAFHTNSAIFSLMQTNLPFEIFKTEHFVRTEDRFVVTEADVSTRTVYEINGEPAAKEYARLMGVEYDKLDATIFATHPVVVRIGGSNYVRSIMTANEDGSMTFACAIDEGIVLSIAEPVDLIEDLDNLFDDLNIKIGKPQLILGCDCLFRSIEIEQKEIKDKVGEIMAENNVIGFSTYGEQFNAMHVNQTFTGVAIGSLS